MYQNWDKISLSMFLNFSPKKFLNSIFDQWIGKSNLNGLVSLQHRLISLQQLPNWSSTITKFVFNNY